MKPKKERFEEWFEDPVSELQNFLLSGQPIMVVAFKDGTRNRVVELSQRDAAQLLEEFGVKPPER